MNSEDKHIALGCFCHKLRLKVILNVGCKNMSESHGTSLRIITRIAHVMDLSPLANCTYIVASYYMHILRSAFSYRI